MVAATLFLGTSACGFRPVYGERTQQSTPVSADLAAIEVAMIPDRVGQQLRNQLESLLNPGGRSGVASRYTLAVQLRENIDTFAVERTGFATRATVELLAAYTLREEASGGRVLAGSSRTISSYNLLDNDFSTVVAADDARTRAVQQIAYEIRNRLAAHFANNPVSPARGAVPAADAAGAEPAVPDAAAPAR